MGLNSRFVKPKSGYEDVTIFLDNNAIVCDAKSFRLGRSQKAPNVKDFIKLQDIRHWLSRYDKKIGGLLLILVGMSGPHQVMYMNIVQPKMLPL